MSSLLASILGYQQNQFIQSEYTSHQLITFDSNEKANLMLKNIWNGININSQSFYVISIIGDARKGKSTFLNLIISHLVGSNVEVFKASNQSETLTHGITMFVCKNIIFLDCEGLAKEGTQRDIKLLLIPYMISNVVIFNDTDDFNDSLIKKLEPLTTLSTFVDYGKKTNKPKLIFRISNYELEGDIKESFKNKIKSTKDKDVAKTIIKTLDELFDSIDIISTPTPDRSDRKLLSNKHYLEFLNKESTEFRPAIEYVLDKVKSGISVQFSSLSKLIEQSVNSINTNDQIKPEYFDTTRIIHNNVINEFIQNIPFKLYDPIIIDGLKTTNYLITNRQQELSNLLLEYDNKFAKVEHQIKNEHREKIKNQIQKQINLAINESSQIAINVYMSQLKSINNELHNIRNEINSLNLHLFSDIDFETVFLNQTIIKIINWLDKYEYGKIHINSIMIQIKDLSVRCKNEFSKVWIKNSESSSLINDILNSWNEDKIINFIESISEKLICYETFDNNILEPLMNEIFNKISIVKFKKITIQHLQNNKFEFVIDELRDNFEFNDYIDIIRKFRNKFVKTDKMIQVYNDYIISEIKSYSETNPFNRLIIDNNPTIKMYYISSTLYPNWHEHNARVNNVYKLFTKKAKIYFEDEIEEIAEKYDLTVSRLMIFGYEINSSKSILLDLGNYKNMTMCEYIIRQMSDTLELKEIDKLYLS